MPGHATPCHAMPGHARSCMMGSSNDSWEAPAIHGKLIYGMAWHDVAWPWNCWLGHFLSPQALWPCLPFSFVYLFIKGIRNTACIQGSFLLCSFWLLMHVIGINCINSNPMYMLWSFLLSFSQECQYRTSHFGTSAKTGCPISALVLK